MKKFIIYSTILAALTLPHVASADVVKRACLASSAKTKSVRLCGCIQAAADATLNGTEQRKTANLISNPELSQDVKASDSWSNERFWKRYTTFSQVAQKYCS